MSCSCNQARSSACNLEIDYSTVPGERILPFQISLNLTDSILDPPAGEHQRLCYDVVAVGQDSSLYADLSHLVQSRAAAAARWSDISDPPSVCL